MYFKRRASVARRGSLSRGLLRADGGVTREVRGFQPPELSLTLILYRILRRM
jgi:hypothetical protein